MKDYGIKCTLGISNIHGIGVFALKDIQIGEELFPCESRYIYIKPEETDAEAINIILDRNVFYKNQELTIEHPNAEVNYTAFMNHSDNPNSDGTHAIKYIKKGEEITENYRHQDMAEISKNHFKFLFT